MDYKQHKFTLLELLVVMVVSLILLAISAPTFLSMSKGQSVDIAGRNFGSELLALRNYSITHRQATALILPTTQTNIPAEFLYRSYRPCIVENITDNSCDFVRWLEDEKWEFLPTGTAILDVDNTSNHDTGPGNFELAGCTNGVQGVDLESIGGSSSSNGLRAFIYNERGVPAPSNFIDTNTAGNIFITIGEAALLQDNVSTMTNQIDILVNSHTGRVTFDN